MATAVAGFHLAVLWQSAVDREHVKVNSEVSDIIPFDLLQLRSGREGADESSYDHPLPLDCLGHVLANTFAINRVTLVRVSQNLFLFPISI